MEIAWSCSSTVISYQNICISNVFRMFVVWLWPDRVCVCVRASVDEEHFEVAGECALGRVNPFWRKQCKLISEKRSSKLWDEQVDTTGDPFVIVVAIQSGTIDWNQEKKVDWKTWPVFVCVCAAIGLLRLKDIVFCLRFLRSYIHKHRIHTLFLYPSLSVFMLVVWICMIWFFFGVPFHYPVKVVASKLIFFSWNSSNAQGPRYFVFCLIFP